MTPETIRNENLDFLRQLGFKPADWLPLPYPDTEVRPERDVAMRLLALDAAFSWVTYPLEEADGTGRLRDYIKRNALHDWFSKDELEIISKSREEAHADFVDTIGWKLENMWALAWALGFTPAPGFESSQIEEEVIESLYFDFLPGLDGGVDDLLAKCSFRDASEIVKLEDRFYCGHNAVRSAQLGEATVPDGFHPVIHGGAIHERRHALTWILSPDDSWDETDLST